MLVPTVDSVRDQALDLVKGYLVVGMIAYHAGVSFIPNTNVRIFVLDRLLDFVSGSWVFVCGLVLTTHYCQRFQVDAWNVSMRLWVRAVRMIVSFSLLNVLVVLLGVTQVSPIFDVTTLAKVFVYGDGMLASFEILLGIGYLLLIGPCFLLFKTAGVVISILLIASEAYLVGMGSTVPGNLWIVLCGLAGMTAGVTVWPAFIQAIHAGSARRWITTGLALSVVIAYYVISIGFGFNRRYLPVYLMGVAGIIVVCYLSYDWFSSTPAMSSWLQLLGRYSLISYISQMILIRTVLTIQTQFAVAWSYWFVFLVVISMLGLIVMGLDQEVRKSKAIRNTYRLIFG